MSNHLIDTQKALTAILQNQYNMLKASGELNENISFAQYLEFNDFIIEPPISKRIKDIVFEYLVKHPLYKNDLQFISGFDQILQTPSKKPAIVIVKQVSIYFYHKVFKDGEKQYFTAANIATLHETTKENAAYAIKTIAGFADTDKTISQILDDITQLINKHHNNNTLKIA